VHSYALESISKETPQVVGTNLITFLRREQRATLNSDNRWSIFDKKSPEKVGVGSILKVTFLTSKTESNRPSSFVGVLIAVRRNEADPTFILRSVVDSVGVEQLFPVFSPLILKIEVVKKAIKQKSNKAYWLREKPEKALEFITSKRK
jgi:large subunit ribosomal protein L19